jgi:hypothetical protein
LVKKIRVDGQEHNKGKPRKDILTASLSVRKVTPPLFRACGFTKRHGFLRRFRPIADRLMHEMQAGKIDEN